MIWIETSTRAKVEHVLDARLAEAARMVSSLLSDHRLELQQAGTITRPVPLPDSHYARQLSCQIWSLDGGLVGRSEGAPQARLTEAAAEGYSLSTVNGEPWRVFTVVNPALDLRVMVGDSLAVRDRLVRDVIEGLLLPAAVILPILAALIWASLGRGLEPLDRLAELLRLRAPSDLSPLPAGPAPQEIRPVRRALDTLFARVAAARDAERDFTTYAAHELKTPLAGLRTQAQVLRMAPDAATRETALRAIETSVDRTDRLVRQLLELAEVDRGSAASEPADLATLVRETVAGLASCAQQRGVRLETRGTDRAQVTDTAPALFEAALRNIVENAINASPPSGRVQVELGDGRVDVIDEGPGIPETDRDRVTERFVRGAAGNGSGLGLAIVASAAERLGWRLELGPSGAPGQRVSLRRGPQP